MGVSDGRRDSDKTSPPTFPLSVLYRRITR